MGTAFRAFVLCVVAGSLVACAAVDGRPANSIDPERDFSAIIINETLNPDRLRALARQPSTDQQTRNNIILARMAEVDILYARYEAKLSSELRRGRFGFSVAEILVGGAGALTTNGAASANWSALSTVLSGTQAAYSRDVLLDQSLQAFVSQMRAGRSLVRARILDRLSEPGSSYTLQAALSDLADYQGAGSLASALAGINKVTQDNETRARQELRNAEERRYNRAPANFTPRSLSLVQYVRNGAPEVRRERNGQVNTCFDQADRSSAPPDLEVTLFVVDAAEYPAIERQVIDCMRSTFGANIS